MAKYLTIEFRFPDDVDVYSETTQSGVLDLAKTAQSAVDARVVGIGEGPDPVAEPENPTETVPSFPENQDGGKPTS